MREEKENREKDYKIKLVCRFQEKQYQQEIYLDNTPAVPENCRQVVEDAVQFLNAFSPASLIQELTEQYTENAVLVFRTTSQQMQNFSEMLHGKFTEQT